MTDHQERIRAAFRLNLEQQKKQAKELIKSAKAGDASARERIARVTDRDPASDFKLADAQFAIARELGLSSWSDLKAHVASMARARDSIDRKVFVPDGDMKTLHVRCGSDIKSTLREAGFQGDFLEHSYPYCHGPVSSTSDHYEIEARFLVELAGRFTNLSFEQALVARRQEDAKLAASTEQYQRIVLWMEHDCFDQLVLIRCLAQYAISKRPPVLEMVDVNHFPGAMRFIGLGQLPVEAIRLLWDKRRTVTDESLQLASKTWEAFTQSEPRPLAAQMRTGCAALPHLGRALHRLLQELPSVIDGMSLTERLVLQVLSSHDASINELLSALTYELDPLPLATDFMLVQTIERMQNLSQPPFTRKAGIDVWRDILAINATGRRLLAGEFDLMSMKPIIRWVGGVEIQDVPTWRWDERKREVVLR